MCSRPGGYGWTEVEEDDGEPFEETMRRLTEKLEEQFLESAELEAEIRASLRGLGYEI